MTLPANTMNFLKDRMNEAHEIVDAKKSIYDDACRAEEDALINWEMADFLKTPECELKATYYLARSKRLSAYVDVQEALMTFEESIRRIKERIQ